MRLKRRIARASLLASVSFAALATGHAVAGVVDYPNGSTNSGAIVITDNSTQLQGACG